MFWLLLMLRKVSDYDKRASMHLRISRQSVVSVVPVVTVLVNVRLKAAATVLGTCTRSTTAVPWWEPGCHQALTTYRHNVSCLKAATRQGNEQQAWLLFPPSLISTLAVFYRKYQIVKQFSLLALFGSSSTSPTFCLRNCPADRQWIIKLE